MPAQGPICRRILESAWTLPVLVLLFCVTRGLLVPFVPLTPLYDCQWYYDRAIDIANGLGYSVNGVPTAFYPVGYPGFLALLFSLFGAHVWVGEVANVVLGAGICLLIHRVSLLMFADRAAAALAVALFVFYPNQAGYIPGISTEVLYPFLILLAAYLVAADRTRMRLILFGLLIGAATLVKSQTLLFPLVILGLPLLANWRWRLLTGTIRDLAIIYVALLVVVLPWTARNYMVFGHFVPVSTNDGAGLYNGSNPYANGDVTPEDKFAPLIGQQLGDTPAVEYESDRRLNALAIEWVKANTGRALALVPRKIWRLWAIDGETEWAYRDGYPGYGRFTGIFKALRWINQIYYTLFVLAAFGAFLMLWRRGRWRSLVILAGPGMILYTTLIAIAFSGQSRYHHFLTPWLVMFAGWLVADRLLSPRERRSMQELPADLQPAR